MSEQVANKKDEQSLETKCPACGASISFNPKAGKWKCEYCGSEFTLEEMQKESNSSATRKNNETTKKEKEIPKDEYSAYVSYKCESCGAEIIADEQTAATFCVYCGNTAILKSKLSGEFAPSKLIPFKKENKEAIEAFKGLSKGRPLMPSNFNNEKNIEKIKGVYIPFWLYDLDVSGTVNMNANVVTTWKRGRTHYTKTDTYNVNRGGSMKFNNIPVDASTRFENDIMNSIEPFNFQELIPYNHAYLSGFYAEKYDEEGEKVLQEASKRAKNTAIDTLKDVDTLRYTTKTVLGNTINAKEENRQYVLLPVWMVNVKYNNKMYPFAMNGQTGEFIGNIPLDKKKVLKYSIIIYIISALVILLGSYILYVIGG